MRRTRNYALPCRHNPYREQGEIPGLVGEWLAGTVLIVMHLVYKIEVNLFYEEITVFKMV